MAVLFLCMMHRVAREIGLPLLVEVYKTGMVRHPHQRSITKTPGLETDIASMQICYLQQL